MRTCRSHRDGEGPDPPGGARWRGGDVPRRLPRGRRPALPARAARPAGDARRHAGSSSPEQWTEPRRPELKALFEHYMYGEMPRPPASVTRDGRPGGPGLPRRQGDQEGADDRLRPAAAAEDPPAPGRPQQADRGPAPVFLGVNFYGNHAALADPTIALPTAWMPASAPGVEDNKATDAGRGKEVGVWSIEKAVDRGYAVATFYCGDVAPDHPGSPTASSPTTARARPRSAGRTTGGPSPPGPGG